MGTLHRYAPRALRSATAVIATGTLIAACGGSSRAHTGGSSRTHTVSFQRAANVSAAAAGYKMDMTMRTSVSGRMLGLDANGSFTPKSGQGSMTMHMSIPSSAGSQSLVLPIVLANDTIFVKLPATVASKIPGHKPWVSINLKQLGQSANLPGLGSMSTDSSIFTNPGEYLDFLRAAAAGSVKDLGQQTVNGVQTTHYQAKLDFSKLPSVVPASQRRAAQRLVAVLQRAHLSAMPVDAWIDGSNLVRRIKVNLNETVAGHPIATAITENFSNYGTQPAPTVPSASQTTNLLSLLHGKQLVS